MTAVSEATAGQTWDAASIVLLFVREFLGDCLMIILQLLIRLLQTFLLLRAKIL